MKECDDTAQYIFAGFVLFLVFAKLISSDVKGNIDINLR